MMLKTKPVATLEMEGEVGTTKVALSNNLVPTHRLARKVFGMFLCNLDTTTGATLTLTIEKDAVIERTLPRIYLPAGWRVDILRPMDPPIFSMGPGQNIKAQVTTGAGPVSVILNCYDV